MTEPEAPWLMVSQAFFEHQMENGVLWLRVANAALARCTPNMHAEFQPGELCKLLLTDASQLTRAIKRAVTEGMLAEDSKPTCLQLSRCFGSNRPGSRKPCPTCTGKMSHPSRVRVKSVPVESADKSSREREQMRWSARRVLTKNVGDYDKNSQ